MAVFLIFSLFITSLFTFPMASTGQLIPALFIFGDSIVDTGNNNKLPTLIKANFLPYGRDFVNHQPTGRFSNGKLAIDIIADLSLGFNSLPPAYLTDQEHGKNLLTGANFASAGSGYYNLTADLNLAISLDKQLDYFKEFHALLVGMVGETNSSSILSDGLYIIGAGSSDFLQNYYLNPLLRVTNPFDQFSNILLQNFVVFVQNLYGMGAKKIGVVNLPPLGCLPGAITLFGFGSNECVERLNIDAISFNRKLNSTSQRLKRTLSGLNLVVLDIYRPLYDLVTSPAEYGFSEARKGCCGTGLLETSILCNSLSVGTCTNASEYVFWDAFHPSEAANNILATSLTSTGSSLIFP